MLFLFKLFILSVLLSLVVAAPLTKRSFKIERVRNPNFKGRNGPRELLKAYQKYRMPVPQPLLDAMNNQRNGTLSTITTVAQTNSAGSCSCNCPCGCGCGGTGAGSPQGQQPNSPSPSPIPQGQPNSPYNPTPQPQSPCNPQPNSPNTPQPDAGGSSGTDAAGEVGVVTATPEQDDVEYLAPVKIGGQTINLDFDSGSSDLWVFNTQLSPQITRGHQVYNPAASKTFKLLQGQTFSISYGDGSAASGNVGTDVVEIGGVAVQNQAVELATKVSQTFIQDTQNNGLLGLAFSKLNTVQPQQQKTFFDNILPSLAEPVFTADLRHNAVGAYEFGRIDNSKFTGQLAWIPVNTAMGFWQFTTSSFSVGNSQAQRVAPAQAIADTGTTLMLVSQAVANAYYSQVQGARNDPNAGGVIFPCNTNLPDLFVDVGGRYMARIKGDDIRFAQIDATSKFVPSSITSRKQMLTSMLQLALVVFSPRHLDWKFGAISSSSLNLSFSTAAITRSAWPSMCRAHASCRQVMTAMTCFQAIMIKYSILNNILLKNSPSGSIGLFQLGRCMFCDHSTYLVSFRCQVDG